MGKTTIEWTATRNPNGTITQGRVWNPTVGCTPASNGCVNCYAQRMYHRFYQDAPFSKIQLHPERFDDPLRWRNPSRVFVDSMSDLFHPDVPMEYILRVWITMTYAQNQTFLILTKRPERMKLFIEEYLPGAWWLATATLKLLDFPLPNVWLGVSAEDQRSADERIPILLGTPAAKRFISVEPMLGPVDLTNINGALTTWQNNGGVDCVDEGKLRWVICGGETGPGARPMHPDWARSLRDQCQDTGVPFFFKSWGDWEPAYVSMGLNAKFRVFTFPDGQTMYHTGKKKAGRSLDGREWNEFPEVGK